MSKTKNSDESVSFVSFPKIGRWSREVIVTEKLDGTNAQIYIHSGPFDATFDTPILVDDTLMFLRAGSRSRWISTLQDNYGFAKWAVVNSQSLSHLGPGVHFGEWWGQGIQRNYRLNEKRFSLFNVSRWDLRFPDAKVKPNCCHVVPILYHGSMDALNVPNLMHSLGTHGSSAAPGYPNPEGMVIYHPHSKALFKKTFVDDEKGKGLE